MAVGDPSRGEGCMPADAETSTKATGLHPPDPKPIVKPFIKSALIETLGGAGIQRVCRVYY